MQLFDSTTNIINNSLDYSTAKNKVISNNLSNIDTPNYKAKEIPFKNILSNEIDRQISAKRTHERHIPFVGDNDKFQVKTKRQSDYNNNGNNVDIDKEMSELAKNQIYYQVLVDRLNGKFGNIQTVLRGGS
ncbi:MAG TPA: flagellar basal body rod protein FlgB [Bacillota bacterium]|nr:flagellar basal body rod protein FlgB [Bacillota bacterium]